MGANLNRLMRSYGVYTPTVSAYSGVATPDALKAGATAGERGTYQGALADYAAQQAAFKGYETDYKNRIANTNFYTSPSTASTFLSTPNYSDITGMRANLSDTTSEDTTDYTNPNFSSMINDAYRSLGRVGIGTDTSNIDQTGYDYWMSQLQAGANGGIAPRDFKNQFKIATNDYIRQKPDDDYTKYIQGYLGILPAATLPVLPTTGGVTTSGTDVDQRAGEGPESGLGGGLDVGNYGGFSPNTPTNELPSEIGGNGFGGHLGGTQNALGGDIAASGLGDFAGQMGDFAAMARGGPVSSPTSMEEALLRDRSRHEFSDPRFEEIYGKYFYADGGGVGGGIANFANLPDARRRAPNITEPVNIARIFNNRSSGPLAHLFDSSTVQAGDEKAPDPDGAGVPPFPGYFSVGPAPKMNYPGFSSPYSLEDLMTADELRVHRALENQGDVQIGVGYDVANSNPAAVPASATANNQPVPDSSVTAPVVDGSVSWGRLDRDRELRPVAVGNDPGGASTTTDASGGAAGGASTTTDASDYSRRSSSSETIAARQAIENRQEASMKAVTDQMAAAGNTAPSQSEMWFRLASAFLSPTKTGKGALGESVALASRELADYQKSATSAASAKEALKLQTMLKTHEITSKQAMDGLKSLERRDENDAVNRTRLEIAGMSARDREAKQTREAAELTSQAVRTKSLLSRELRTLNEAMTEVKNAIFYSGATPEPGETDKTAYTNSPGDILSFNAQSLLPKRGRNERFVATESMRQALSSQALQLASSMKGALSDKDLVFLKELAGLSFKDIDSRNISLAETVKKLQRIIDATQSEFDEVSSGAWQRKTRN